MAGREPHWAAVDWGTSHLRAWTMDASGAVLESLRSEKGMGRLGPEEFEPVLAALLAPHMPASGRLPVIACGMVGARQGWREAPYARTPCKPPSIAQAARIACESAALDVWILPGVSQERPADVMRGEETQIAGLVAAAPGLDGVACLPGTHSKWAQLSAGEIVSFRTFMTGEMFALLGESSVLRHSVAGPDWDDAAFETAVDDAISRPHAIAAELFSIRAASLIAGLGQGPARARLSGLLIGMELAASRPYWLGQEIRIVGASGLAGAYRAALEAQGASVTLVPGDDTTLRGLHAAYRDLEETLS